ncbi:NAD(P)-binding protein [Eremomyces bilateralis CBS 781.70]|uniref:NAD(P)-binding protein n=1 Tax=Eremomyces bilateralis CBS 781.70 TaxID=1392243 RepID=A0A6G1G1H3_9PEZI|nr:NAD(P)-binding protein [Eremomyces bilateralis CBS 781.70]KAF1811893.1 NAD(P)-binding protein [Eremomyces bilateralis CBS 781.70]
MACRLKGKVATITGSYSGLGRAIVLAYAAEGAAIFSDSIHNRTLEPTTLEELCRLYPGREHMFVKVDVTKANDMRNGIALCVKKTFDDTMVTNAKRVFLGCKYAIRQMVLQKPLPDTSYCASKGAVIQLTRQIALNYAGSKIHSNCLCPGFLITAMTQHVQSDPLEAAQMSKDHPLRGLGKPENVARAAVFLASEDVRWMTGPVLPVDGGYTCH